ncbi:MAG: hypothetical protein H7Z75_07570 [Ferruginibacter sp.]|nr:hypothetical protein [Cytophagales bacterium]
MNKSIVLAAVIAVFFGCEAKKTAPGPKSLVTICGVKDSAKELAWLKEIIAKAEDDRTNKTYSGNYLGSVYLEKFNGQDVFYTDMAMGSGGLAFRLFTCDGQPVSFSSNEQMLSFVKAVQKSKLIYSNLF